MLYFLLVDKWVKLRLLGLYVLLNSQIQQTGPSPLATCCPTLIGPCKKDPHHLWTQPIIHGRPSVTV